MELDIPQYVGPEDQNRRTYKTKLLNDDSSTSFAHPMLGEIRRNHI